MKNIIFSTALLLIFTFPFFVIAAPSTQLVICNTNLDPNTGKFTDPCTFDSLVNLAINFMNFMIMISVPLAAIAFIIAGFLMLTSAGSQDKISRAKDIFWKTFIGFVFILSAWLIVKLIVTALTGTPFTLLG